MSGVLAWALVGLALLVLVVRRRSWAVGLVTAQALVLAGIAVERATGDGDATAAILLAVRAVGLAVLFLLVVARTREQRRVRPRASPLVRAGVGVAFALALTALVPHIGLRSRGAEQAVLALVAFGIVIAAMRRATLFQILGVVVLENALALAALELPGSSSPAIELGVTLDLAAIALVATVFHERIFAEFGAGDSAVLRSLRD